MFDMREDGEADPCKLAQMMQNLGVFISVKPKIKQTSKVRLHQRRSAGLFLIESPSFEGYGNPVVFVLQVHRFHIHFQSERTRL